MKFTALLTLIGGLALCAQADSSFRLDMNGDAGMTVSAESAGIRLKPQGWKKADLRKSCLYGETKLPADRNTTLKVLFRTDRKGTVIFEFAGSWNDDPEKRSKTALFEIQVNGKSVPEGGFTRVKTDAKKGIKLPQGFVCRGAPVYAPADGDGKSASVLVDHDNRLILYFKAEAETDYVMTISCRGTAE